MATVNHSDNLESCLKNEGNTNNQQKNQHKSGRNYDIFVKGPGNKEVSKVFNTDEVPCEEKTYSKSNCMQWFIIIVLGIIQAICETIAVFVILPTYDQATAKPMFIVMGQETDERNYPMKKKMGCPRDAVGLINVMSESVGRYNHRMTNDAEVKQDSQTNQRKEEDSQNTQNITIDAKEEQDSETDRRKEEDSQNTQNITNDAKEEQDSQTNQTKEESPQNTQNTQDIKNGQTNSSKVGNSDSDTMIPFIYLCATMWHETEQEMRTLLRSIFRLNEHQFETTYLQNFRIGGNKQPDETYFQFEAHIFFDDAFKENKEKIKGVKSKQTEWKRYPGKEVNDFVKQFIKCVEDTARYGPVVWYQKFEYAVSHWLQKATEHVYGCVLCSPGCFSLFRASALMSDDVIKIYTGNPSTALECIQFDQGEDRWLSTLLLKQGFKLEYTAASDAYTYVPEGFFEFFNQRRRWSPSTLANIFEIILNISSVSNANNFISKPYLFYHSFLFVSSFITPGTIFLMILGATNLAFPGIPIWLAFLINITLIGVVMLSCVLADQERQVIIFSYNLFDT
uniref:chitin synthase n=1 Tax=Magallana gigas TaxID=29159 RepID=K1QLT9_MAGGI